VLLAFAIYLFQNKTEEDLLSTCAVLKLLPFPTTYLCEAGFSWQAVTQSKHRYRLFVVPDIRIQFSTITPNLKEFVRQTALFFTLVAYEIRLTAYSNSDSSLFSCF
jgi:hypothetical protein